MNLISIKDMESPELKRFSGLSESALAHYYEPAPGLFIAESPMIIQRALDAGYIPESVLLESKCQDRMHDLLHRLDHVFRENLPKDRDSAPGTQLPVYLAPLEMLNRITGFMLTRGILCAMKRKALPDAADLVREAGRLVILENVMNPRNLGAIFRSAAALGMDAVLLSKGCTDPLYRRAARVSMGTVFQIPWTYLDPWPASVDLLKEQGFQVAAMALQEDSVSMSDFVVQDKDRIALVLGTEGPGLDPATIRLCDRTVKIPMSHGVDSLNVAAASAVAFWQIRRETKGRTSYPAEPFTNSSL